MIQLLGLILLFNIDFIASQGQYNAISVLLTATNIQGETATGIISFSSNNQGNTTVSVHITGIVSNPDGLHGLNIFSYGDLRGFLQAPFNQPGTNVVGVKAFGERWLPVNVTKHGCPEIDNANAGNLGNWQATGGSIIESRTMTNIHLAGDASIVGRSIGLYDTFFNCTSGNIDANAKLIAYAPIGIAHAANGATNLAAASTGHTKAVCVFTGTSSCTQTCTLNNGGFAILTATNNSRIHLTAQVNSISTPRGIHVHWFGDLNSTDGTSAGSHYNPDNQVHGLPGLNPNRHLGDFGSIQDFSGGFGYYDYAPEYTPATSVNLDHFIGRAIVIHSSVDHGDEATCPDAANTGNSGVRNYVCVIGIANTNPANTNSDQLTEPNLPNNFVQNSTWGQIPCSSGQPDVSPQPDYINQPTDQPTNPPTNPPTDAPTNPPTNAPTNPPTDAPTNPPVYAPSGAQSLFQAIGFALIIFSQIVHLY